VTTIDIAKQFSRYPFGRYRNDGPYSGERFRDEFLIPALEKNSADVSVIFDGANGMGSSFLEEAFGGLVRKGIPKNDLLRRLKLISKDATRIHQVQEYIREAEAPR
jgi:hypothetical protein